MNGQNTMLSEAINDCARLRLTVRGIVQGVGFRPFVYGLARRYRLAGHVGNNSAGVFIEVEGAPEAVKLFQNALAAEAPVLAHIESVLSEHIPACGESAFTILPSQTGDVVLAQIPPDVGLCADCMRELFDRNDRRYRYPFINCTHCGPRFTIIQALPYDRAATTMSGFTMCSACAAEYHDPLSRRFHAQPVACPSCGPQVWYQAKDGAVVHGSDAAIEAAREALHTGLIAAVKGLGGFHLACDATHDAALHTLRTRKGRVDKPFAVMVRDLDMARAVAEISAEEAALLSSQQRPIVLVRKRKSRLLSDLVAPGNPYVGLMLPYTPLHFLIMDEQPLVMTSGNVSGEPIAIDNDEAAARLASLVDVFLFHDRSIHQPCDDSVVRVHDGHELPIRRSRGYTPYPITLPFDCDPVLAVGGELKNTFCVTQQNHAYMSQHIGDMENLETLNAFERAQAHFCDLYRTQPEALVCDLHPGYLTTQWAERQQARTGVPLIRVQHHHAHIAAVMAERGLDGAAPVIGVSMDGTGYGTDGTIWGGEFLIADYTQFTRAGFLKPVPMPGGDTAVKKPYRMALAHLWAASLAWDNDLPPVRACSPAERRVLAKQFESGFQTIQTSSMGRLFDAVAALAGVRQTVTYEAQAAIEFEGLAADCADKPYQFDMLKDRAGILVMDASPVIRSVVEDVRGGVDTGVISARFHEALTLALCEGCTRLREIGHGSVVALSGGVFQNVRLRAAVARRLDADGFTVLTHCKVPDNDGGLALGQAVIGLHRMRSGLETGKG